MSLDRFIKDGLVFFQSLVQIVRMLILLRWKRKSLSSLWHLVDFSAFTPYYVWIEDQDKGKRMMHTWLNWVDIIGFLIVLFSSMGGYQSGFAKIVAQLVSFITFVFCLFFVYPPLHEYVREVYSWLGESYLVWALLLSIVLFSYLLFSLSTRLLIHLLKRQVSERTDRIYGATLGFCRGILLLFSVLVFLAMVGPKNLRKLMKEDSHMGRFVIMKAVPYIQPYLSEETIGDEIRKLQDRLMVRPDAFFE